MTRQDNTKSMTVKLGFLAAALCIYSGHAGADSGAAITADTSARASLEAATRLSAP